MLVVGERRSGILREETCWWLFGGVSVSVRVRDLHLVQKEAV